MKTITYPTITFYTILFFFSFQTLAAQNCDSFYPLKKGNSFEMQEFDGQNKLTGTNMVVVKDRKDAGGMAEATMQATHTNAKGKTESSVEFKVKCDGSVFYMEFNHRDGKATRNKNLRLAIAAMFSPDEYVKAIIGIPGTIPGTRLIPSWVPGVKDKLAKEFPMAKRKQNLEAAKKYVAEARKELGEIKSLVWLTGDSPTASKEAEYFQAEFKKHLGIDLKIDKQIFKQRLAKMTAGEFDIVAAGWGPDYADAMTFADLFASWNENNRGRWKNDKYDELIRKAQGTADAKVRVKAMADAEAILMGEGAIMPTYERRVAYLVSDRVKNVVRNTIGPDPDFTQAEVIK